MAHFALICNGTLKEHALPDLRYTRPRRLARGISPCQIKGQKAGGWIWALPDQMP
jgi:hypothetical protein